MKNLDDITGNILDASIKIHKGLGPGLLESVYESVLARDLERRGFQTVRQKAIRFEYDGMSFEDGLRVDLLVEDQVIVELKSLEVFLPIHKKELLTYLRLSGLSVGLLINFGAPALKDGFRRIVNYLQSPLPLRPRTNQPNP
ncbi:MAG: GxxExxY protein [Puniceicoccales bacterium]|jgi:iron complex transport system substrate-binding protein|nr:GxxExxY protein [Puniceicoccales bacterium]